MAIFCPSCRKQLPDTADFCDVCGTRVNPAFQGGLPPVGQQAPLTPPPQFQTQPQQQAHPQLQYQQQNFSVPASAWLVDPNEKIKFSLKNGFLTNIISSEGFINEDAIITDKRLYYNVTSWNSLIKHRTEMKIDLDDITATTITDFNPILILILGAIAFFASFIIIDNSAGALALGFIIAIVSVIEWWMMKKTYFKIEYAGGSSMGGMRNNGALYFSVKKYGMDAIRAFQKEIHLAKTELNKKKYKM